MATDIDLEKDDPGKMFGGADNAKDYTFFLFRTDAGITPKDLESKGAGGVPQKSLIFSSPVMPDEKNRALVDIKDHAKKIKGILSEAKTPAIAAVLATARPGNENPNAKVAVFQPVTLHCKPQKLKLNVLKGSAGKEDWVTYHHSILYVELVAKDIPQITWELNPKTKWFQSPIMMTGIWEQAQPGTNQIGGKMLVGCVGDKHAANPKCTLSPAHHGSAWWPLWSTQINNQHAPQTLKLSPGVSNYVMGLYPRFAGSYTLTVTGTGPLADQKATVNLSSSGTPTGD
jgi:hypothetical protein